MITAILWDVDGTLLNFHAAEYATIRNLFEEFHLGTCTDEMIHRYSVINDSFWKQLERNEITKKEVLIGRFVQFFSEMGIDPSLAETFNDRYQNTLGETVVFCDDSYTIIASLRGKVKQYVVSNGTKIAQTKKLSKSGLGELMDGIYLSEVLGVEKPNVGFFEQVFKETGITDLSQVMIVGDSLTSDIRGGINAGIRTCWYNPGHKPVPEGYTIDHVISDLHEVYEIIK